MMTSRPAKRNSYHLIESVGQDQHLPKIALSEPLYDRFLTNFHKNCGNVTGDKNVISADLVN